MGHLVQLSLCSTWLFWCICEPRSRVQVFHILVVQLPPLASSMKWSGPLWFCWRFSVWNLMLTPSGISPLFSTFRLSCLQSIPLLQQQPCLLILTHAVPVQVVEIQECLCPEYLRLEIHHQCLLLELRLHHRHLIQEEFQVHRQLQDVDHLDQAIHPKSWDFNFPSTKSWGLSPALHWDRTRFLRCDQKDRPVPKIYDSLRPRTIHGLHLM